MNLNVGACSHFFRYLLIGLLSILIVSITFYFATLAVAEQTILQENYTLNGCPFNVTLTDAYQYYV